jgi:MoxR-like ATPase
MNVNEMSKAIVVAYAAKEPVMLRGAPGIGKSAGMLEACRIIASKLGLKGGVWQWGDPVALGLTIKDYFGFVDLRLSQCDPVDVGGLPFADHTNGTQHRLCPSWFPHTTREDLPDYGILALEEIVSAPQSVQAAAYQLTLDRRIGDQRMKDGWSMVLTGNRMTDGGVVFKMPTPLANRVTHLDIESDVGSWREWAIDNDIELSVVAFISLRPDLLNTFDRHVKERLAGDAFATERTWEKASKYVKTGEPDTALFPLIAGALSEGTGAEYMGFRQMWEQKPDLDAVLMDPLRAPLPDDAATQYAVAVGLGARATKDNIDNVVAYVDRFNTEQGRPEIAVLALKDAIRRTPGVVQSKAFSRWAVTNRELFN